MTLRSRTTSTPAITRRPRSGSEGDGHAKCAPWLGPLAATTAASGGDRAGARKMLDELLAAEEPYIRRAAGRTMAQLEALDRIDGVRTRIELFRARTGHDLSGWPEMIAAGVIPSVPIDPAGVPFTYDAATKTPALAPNSPLLPLPPMLRPK